jgi:hypothetical protein
MRTQGDKTMRILPAFLATAALCASLAVPARAGEAADPARDWTVRATGSLVGQSELENDRGKVSVAQTGLAATWRWLTLAYSLRSYDFEDVARLPFGNGREPFDQLHRVVLSADHGGQIEGRWSWFGGATLASAFEEEMEDSYSGMVRGGVGYALDGDLDLRLGAAVSAHPIGVRALPLVSLAWNRKAEQGWSALLGAPQTEARYRWNAAWATRAALGLEGGTWRLADDSPVRREGYFSEQGLKAGLYQDVNLTEAAFLSLGLTWSFARSMEVYNADGDKSGDWDLDPALGGSISFGLRF